MELQQSFFRRAFRPPQSSTARISVYMNLFVDTRSVGNIIY